MSMEHLYTPALEPVRHFSEPRLPIEPKRFVSDPKFISKPRLSSFAQFMEDFKLPKRYDLSKINTLTNWREDLYRSTFRHGDFSRHMTRSFLDTCDNKSFNEAMIQVQAANDRLLINGHSAAMSDDEIKDLASAKSRAFKKQILSLPEPEQFAKACQLLASLGLSFRDELIKEKGKKR
ncbi:MULTISPECIES: hypothetical protein [Vibrio]|uniref:hypothetical protein n=1 Tax=Vibrio TaxID=662 RepID=UPI00148257AC|nr:hypothetical protein [Vibrio sp. 3-2(1)]NNN70792.1 hypothetical protein [Vibrio sp. 3-2(1)]